MKFFKKSYLLARYLQISQFTNEISPNKDVFANEKNSNI